VASYQGTYRTIKDAVIDTLHLDATDDETRVGNEVNLAYQDVVQTTGCLQATATATMTDGVSSYALPAAVAWIKELVVVYADGTVSDPLTQISLDEMLGWRRTTLAVGQQTAQPSYALAGQGQIEVWPTPGADQTLQFWYVYLPDALTADGDEPVILEPYGSRLLMYGACVELARFKKDPLLPDLEAQYGVWLGKFQAWMNFRQGSSPRSVRVIGTSLPLNRVWGALANDVG